jgi:hypothetical protein
MLSWSYMKHLLSKLNNDELIALATRVSGLTDFARAEVSAEVQRRGFSSIRDAIKSQGITRDGKSI